MPESPGSFPRCAVAQPAAIDLREGKDRDHIAIIEDVVILDVVAYQSRRDVAPIHQDEKQFFPWDAEPVSQLSHGGARTISCPVSEVCN